MAHKARNKKTGEITEIWFAMCDHGRKYCFADDYPQDDYRIPMAVTDNYEIIANNPMKENELMIGDFVSCNGFQKQIDFIDLQSICFDQDIAEPIPLTAEILKANGWEKNKFSSAYINHGVPFRLDIGICCLWLDHEWDDYYNAFSFQYVHQLQNALRLCGLNDLADNFKV